MAFPVRSDRNQTGLAARVSPPWRSDRGNLSELSTKPGPDRISVAMLPAYAPHSARLGVGGQLGIGPLPWEHDRGADAAELGGDGLAQERFAAVLAVPILAARTPDDAVERARAARDVHGRVST